jgi:hypothetical protein
LLAETQRAAADEVRHARICFALAAAYAGAPVEPGKFPLARSGQLSIETELASIAAATFAEGCVEETLSCLAMAEAGERCEDRCVKTALTSIVKVRAPNCALFEDGSAAGAVADAQDEARHAVLAWRTVEWAVEQGGSSARKAVAAAFEREMQERLPAASASESGDAKSESGSESEAAPSGDARLEAFGRLSSRSEVGVNRAALRGVVAPLTAALLAGRPLSLSLLSEGGTAAAKAREVLEQQFPGAARAVEAVLAGLGKQ